VVEAKLRYNSPVSSSDGHQPLADQLVVFTGKLRLLGRRQARDLVARLGGATANEVTSQTTMLVVGAAGFGPEPHSTANDDARQTSNKLRRAEELNAHQSRQIRIISEEDFCQLAGVPSAARLKQQYHAMSDLVSRYRFVREDQLRYLVKCGLLRPVLRTNTDVLFEFPDLAMVKQLHEALAQGATFRSVVRALMASRHGQLELDFRLDASPAKIIALREHSKTRASAMDASVAERNTAMAEECFLAASALDNGDAATVDEAATIYRRALEIDPSLAPALINLANIHYSRNELAEAQALYERAIGLESDFFEAHFNLGNIYHDLGRFREAQACYRETLQLNPGYADAHFYLAVTLEKSGRSEDARPHWRAYQQLAPDGEWVELAKEFSD
jgi:tetratricopeptide (TPR) repeat protein